MRFFLASATKTQWSSSIFMRKHNVSMIRLSSLAIILSLYVLSCCLRLLGPGGSSSSSTIAQAAHSVPDLILWRAIYVSHNSSIHAIAYSGLDTTEPRITIPFTSDERFIVVVVPMYRIVYLIECELTQAHELASNLCRPQNT